LESAIAMLKGKALFLIRKESFYLGQVKMATLLSPLISFDRREFESNFFRRL